MNHISKTNHEIIFFNFILIFSPYFYYYRYDFYLISQSVGQGTVNPTSYNIILDESGWPPDRIQVLTYKLTHLYYNWPGTVRVPAPCRYAHKLADLVGGSLKEEVNPELTQQNVLYYL